MAKSLLISEAFDLYRTDFIVFKNRSSKTEEAYCGTKKLLIKKLGDILINDLTFEMVRDWRNWLATWQKPDTVRNNIVCLRMVLKFLSIRGEGVLNYENIPVAKRDKRKVTFLTEEEVKLLIKEASRKVPGYSKEQRLRNIVIIKLLYATGLRNSELCSLNKDDIKERSFTVIGKSRDPRICFITEEVEQNIDAYLTLRKDNQPALFTSPRTGKRITPGTVRRIFESIRARNSKFRDVHPHTIRHSFATRLVNHDVDILYVGTLLGHADLNTTRMYTHLANPKLKAIYEKAMAG